MGKLNVNFSSAHLLHRRRHSTAQQSWTPSPFPSPRRRRHPLHPTTLRGPSPAAYARKKSPSETSACYSQKHPIRLPIANLLSSSTRVVCLALDTRCNYRRRCSSRDPAVKKSAAYTTCALDGLWDTKIQGIGYPLLLGQ